MDDIISILTPAIGSRMLSTEQREAFERGLSMLERNPKAKAFIDDSRRFRDYHRRVRQLVTYLQTMRTTPAPSSAPRRHVGRPTIEEQAAYARERKLKALEEARQGLFPEVQPDISLQPLTYNGIVANPDGESIAASMPNLMQLRPFLSARLQEQVNSVRALRNEMAAKAEQAKTMVLANEKALERGASAPLYTEAEIAELATRAVKLESDVLPSIYMAVDREMGEAYLRLSPKNGDPEYIDMVRRQWKLNPQQLRQQFRPFYDKAQRRDPAFATAVAARIAEDRPEVKAERDRAARHKSEADAMIKYITRRDKKSTLRRVKGLAERIDLLRQRYSDVVSPEALQGYEAILTHVREEAEV